MAGFRGKFIPALPTATHSGPLYASKAPLARLLAMQPTPAAAQPLGGGKSQCYHQHRAPAQARGNNGRWRGLNGGGRRQATCPTKTQASIDLIINTLNIIASRFICKCLVDNILTQWASSPHPNFPNIRDRFQEKHEKNFFPA